MVTMNDIAVRTGVSRSTVSYVLNGRAAQVRIPDETQQRILEVASEMGYRHNELARSVAWGKSRMLAFITEEPGADVEFKSKVMVGAIEAAAQRGYTVQVLYLPPLSFQSEVVERCIEWRVAGVVTLALHSKVIEELHREIARHEMEMAVLEDAHSYPWAINVSSASSDGLIQAIEHLQQLGHSRIAMLAASARDDHSMWREQLFRKLCREHSIEIAHNGVAYGDWWDPEANEVASHQLLQQNPRPTAVICCGDSAAMMLLNTARSLGIQVPKELSIVGYGDYSFSIFAAPRLTTVTQPFRDLGRLAVNRLLDRVVNSSHDWDELQRFTLPASLTVRASTGPAPVS